MFKKIVQMYTWTVASKLTASGKMFTMNLYISISLLQASNVKQNTVRGIVKNGITSDSKMVITAIW